MRQNTLKHEISFSGVGLHSGLNVNIRIMPAEENAGIIFKRVDIKEYDNEIKALFSSVVNTKLGTTIGNKFGAVVQTIEHLMAAFWACDIDNAIVEIDNREVPIMDGSAEIFINEIKKAEIQEQDEDRKYLKILKNVEIVNNEQYSKLSPFDNYKIELDVNFPYGGIGKQSIIFDGNPDFFIHEVSRARTFCSEKEIEYMKQNGLARGGSLDNAMVFNDNTILNPGGFRCDKEVVKHKLLDCIGDMYTSGYYIKGQLKTNMSGHTLNNEILRKLFSSKENYTIE